MSNQNLFDACFGCNTIRQQLPSKYYMIRHSAMILFLELLHSPLLTVIKRTQTNNVRTSSHITTQLHLAQTFLMPVSRLVMQLTEPTVHYSVSIQSRFRMTNSVQVVTSNFLSFLPYHNSLYISLSSLSNVRRTNTMFRLLQILFSNIRMSTSQSLAIYDYNIVRIT